MTEVEAVVSRLEGDNVMVVDVTPERGCGRCDEPGGCGGGLAVAKPCVRTYRFQNDIGAAVGDAVLLGLPEGAVLGAAAWAYLMPGILAIVGALLAIQIAAGDISAIVGAVVGLLLGILALRLMSARGLSRNKVFSVRLKV